MSTLKRLYKPRDKDLAVLKPLFNFFQKSDTKKTKEFILQSPVLESFGLFIKYLDIPKLQYKYLKNFLTLFNRNELVQFLVEAMPNIASITKNGVEIDIKKAVEEGIILDLTVGDTIEGKQILDFALVRNVLLKRLLALIKTNKYLINSDEYSFITSFLEPESPSRNVSDIIPKYIQDIHHKIINGLNPKYTDWLYFVRFHQSIGTTEKKVVSILKKSPLWDPKNAEPQIKWIFSKKYGAPTKRELILNGYDVEDGLYIF